MISNTRTRVRSTRRPEQILRVGFVLQSYIQPPAVRLDRPHHRQRANEIGVPLQLEGDRVGLVPGPNLIERAVDDHFAPVDQHDEVAQPLRLVHHVRGKQDGLALPPQAADDLPQHVLVHRVETRERLIENHEVRVIDHRHDELELLVHSPRKLLDLLAGMLGQIDPLEPCGHLRCWSRPAGIPLSEPK